MQWFLEQAMSLTFEFNKCIPNPGKRIDRILVLSDLAEVDSKIESTRSLLKLEFANSLLLAAQYRINDDNPTDYIYRVRFLFFIRDVIMTSVAKLSHGPARAKFRGGEDNCEIYRKFWLRIDRCSNFQGFFSFFDFCKEILDMLWA